METCSSPRRMGFGRTSQKRWLLLNLYCLERNNICRNSIENWNCSANWITITLHECWVYVKRWSQSSSFQNIANGYVTTGHWFSNSYNQDVMHWMKSSASHAWASAAHEIVSNFQTISGEFLLQALKIPSNTICTLMTPSCTSLSLLANSAVCLETLTTTFTDILSWMNKLLLNPSKTEFHSHWHKTTASQIFWSYKLISQQWYHPSQFLCSQSWLHLWLWHVFFWTNKLCFQILSYHFHIRDIRHLLPLSAATALANSLVSSKLD